MATDGAFHYEVEESVDGQGWKTTTIKALGKLVSGDGPELDRLVKPLIHAGGSILIDLTDLSYIDSSGLGSLVALKVSAINKGYCKLELVNLSPKVKQLLTMTNLLQLFSHS
jgi:anti-anti-sigma factor